MTHHTSYEFPGATLVKRRGPFSSPPPRRMSRERRMYVAGKQVLAVLYNSGQHLYEDWSNSWPRDFESWEQCWQLLSYKRYYHEDYLWAGKARLRHLGHLRVRHVSDAIMVGNGPMWVEIQTRNEHQWHKLLYPGVLYYLIDLGNGSEAFFESRKLIVPSELLPLG